MCTGQLEYGHFGITKKPMMNCTLPYNKAGLISEVSEKQPVKMLKISVVNNPTVV